MSLKQNEIYEEHQLENADELLLASLKEATEQVKETTKAAELVAAQWNMFNEGLDKALNHECEVELEDHSVIECTCKLK